jgi:HPt (histidine-containing phosphotransfer) domain-containing protein
MDGYVSKPIDSRGLFVEIEKCLTDLRKGTPMTKVERNEQLDRVSLLSRVEGDRELLAEIIQVFLADAPQLVVAMGQALAQGDMHLLERSAHSMKGAAANLSALDAVKAASRLEQSAKNKDSESSKTDLSELRAIVERLLPVLADLCQEVSK